MPARVAPMPLDLRRRAFAFGRPDVRELRLPLLGLLAALALAGVQVGIDIAIDEATEGEPHRVTPWLPLVLAGLLLAGATFADRFQPTFLSAGLALGMLYYTLDVQHHLVSFLVSLSFVALLPLLRLPAPVRIVAALTAIPIVLLAGQKLGGTEPLALQAAISAADLALLAALLAGSPWRTVPYWGLTLLGAGAVAVSAYAVAYDLRMGDPVLWPSAALAAGALLLHTVLRWPTAAWGARFHLRPPVTVPSLRRPRRLQAAKPLPPP